MMKSNLISTNCYKSIITLLQPNSSDIISITRGRASSAACTLRKDIRNRLAKISMAVAAYSRLTAYRIWNMSGYN